MRPRISIRGCVRPSVRRFVGWLVGQSITLSLRLTGNQQKWSKLTGKQSKFIRIVRIIKTSSQPLPKFQTLQNIIRTVPKYPPNCPKMSNSDASLSERTCFLYAWLTIMSSAFLSESRQRLNLPTSSPPLLISSDTISSAFLHLNYRFSPAHSPILERIRIENKF